MRNEWGGQFFVFHKARGGGDRFLGTLHLHGNWSFARPSQRGNAMPLSSYRPPVQVICVPYTHIMQCLDTLLARNHFAVHQGTRPAPMTDVGPRLCGCAQDRKYARGVVRGDFCFNTEHCHTTGVVQMVPQCRVGALRPSNRGFCPWCACFDEGSPGTVRSFFLDRGTNGHPQTHSHAPNALVPGNPVECFVVASFVVLLIIFYAKRGA